MNYYFTFCERKHYPSVFEYREELRDVRSSFDGCMNLDLFETIESWDFDNKLFEYETTVPPGYSLAFQYLYMDGDEVIGMINFRPKAESHPHLSQYGGHIGYNVKPSRRGQGVGKQMLKDFLPIAKTYGLDKVMVSCMEDNPASRKIITSNGGVLENIVYYPAGNGMLERYWIKL